MNRLRGSLSSSSSSSSSSFGFSWNPKLERGKSGFGQWLGSLGWEGWLVWVGERERDQGLVFVMNVGVGELGREREKVVVNGRRGERSLQKKLLVNWKGHFRIRFNLLSKLYFSQSEMLIDLDGRGDVA